MFFQRLSSRVSFVFSGLNSCFMEVYSGELVAQLSCFYVNMLEWEVFSFKIYELKVQAHRYLLVKLGWFRRNKKNEYPLAKRG